MLQKSQTEFLCGVGEQREQEKREQRVSCVHVEKQGTKSMFPSFISSIRAAHSSIITKPPPAKTSAVGSE
jgi:hypothetical protein